MLARVPTDIKTFLIYNLFRCLSINPRIMIQFFRYLFAGLSGNPFCCFLSDFLG